MAGLVAMWNETSHIFLHFVKFIIIFFIILSLLSVENRRKQYMRARVRFARARASTYENVNMSHLGIAYIFRAAYTYADQAER